MVTDAFRSRFHRAAVSVSASEPRGDNLRTNNDKQRKPYRIYDRGIHQWYEVTPERYKEFDRWHTAKRKREQYHHRCMCPRNRW